MEINNYELYHGDCLVEMDKIADKSIDMVLTSPPYDNLRTYNNSLEWGEHIWKPCIEKLYRVVKDGGVVVWVVGDATINGSETGTSFKQALYFKEVGFNLHDTMIYQKTGCPYPSKNRYYQNFEFMFVFSKNTPKSTNIISDRENIYSGYTVNRPKSGNRQIDGSIRQKGCDKKGVERKVKDFGVRYNIWRISHVDKSRSLHPATFPLQLSQDHVISWSNEGDLICDPFMGSGTTGVACMNTNRRFIGIEKEKQYFDIAQKRIEDATKQGKIWK